MKKISIFTAIFLIGIVMLTSCKQEVSVESMEINYGELAAVDNEKLNKYDSLTWTSADESVASVNSIGEIVGNGIGTVVLTAWNNDKIVAEYTVTVNIVPATGIVLSTNSTEMTVEDEFQLNYTLFPDSASDYGISWKSADENVAIVNNEGYILAKSVGQTTISVSNESGIMATCSVTVKDRPAYERLSDEERKFVDLALKHIGQFKNPDSVTIRGLYKTAVDSTADWYVSVSAQNGFGGMNTTDYTLDSTGFSENIISWRIYDDKYDLDLINEAINEKR